MTTRRACNRRRSRRSRSVRAIRRSQSPAPIRDGFALRLSGDQLDLKPMLQRFFGLGGGTGGPQSTLVSQTLSLDLKLKRALGFYQTIAYNMQMQLQLKGTDIQRASVQAQFGNNKSMSITTNPAPDGKVLSVAFNDLGTLLRFGGVYARIEGGRRQPGDDHQRRPKGRPGRFRGAQLRAGQ